MERTILGGEFSKLPKNGIAMKTMSDVFRTSMRATDSAPGLARTLTTTQLQKWDLTDIADYVLLIVSELTTNAIRETPEREIHFRLARYGTTVVVAVWDRSRRPPVVRRTTEGPFPEIDDFSNAPSGSSDASSDRDGGRGLVLVRSVATDWGYRRNPRGGKWVWAIVKPDPNSTRRRS